MCVCVCECVCVCVWVCSDHCSRWTRERSPFFSRRSPLGLVWHRRSTQTVGPSHWQEHTGTLTHTHTHTLSLSLSLSSTLSLSLSLTYVPAGELWPFVQHSPAAELSPGLLSTCLHPPPCGLCPCGGRGGDAGPHDGQEDQVSLGTLRQGSQPGCPPCGTGLTGFHNLAQLDCLSLSLSGAIFWWQ